MSRKIHSMKMSCSSPELATIADCPNEILIKIMLYLNLGDRVALGNSCQRLKSVVFGTPELLRDLDFSQRDKRIRFEDIQQYFSDEKAEHIVKLNFGIFECKVKLDISRAINLVELDVRGTEFKNVRDLASFLEPLEYLKRLSIDWPDLDNSNSNANVILCQNLFQKQFSKLEYLSFRVPSITEAFFFTLNLCQKLRELHVNTMTEKHRVMRIYSSLREKGLRLNSLKIMHIYGVNLCDIVAEDFMNMLTENPKWAEFQLNDRYSQRSFYLEKDLQVDDALRQIKSQYSDKFGWSLIPEYLLKRVIEITHEDVPREFCCFRCSDDCKHRPILIKINEAKRLLMDPTYQISYLRLKHHIESDCDAHLVTSAFPNLTEIVLSDIVKKIKSTSSRRRMKNLARRLRKRGSVELEQNSGPKRRDSSFKMLAENTPSLTRLTIAGNMKYDEGLERWDFDALYSIRLWKNLRALHLKSIPITDGNFFIDIGKECVNLEEIVLQDLGPGSSTCYMSGLCEMLSSCKNLREFSFYHYFIDDMCNLLDSLSNNLQLKSVRFWTEPNISTNDFMDVIPSIELLLGKCEQITTFIFMTHYRMNRDALRRIVNKLDRRNLDYSEPHTRRKHHVSSGIPNLFDHLDLISCSDHLDL